MAASVEPAHEPASAGPVFKPITLGWALRRTALAVLILSLFLGTMAWLIHASIDPQLERENARTAATEL